MANYKNIEVVGTSKSTDKSSLTLDSSAPKDQSSLVTSSSRGYSQTSESTSQQEQEVTPKLTEAESKQLDKDITDEFDKAKKTTVTKQDELEAAKMFKSLLQTRLNNFNSNDFKIGNMLFYRYNAKYKNNPYDKTPLVIILRRSRGYVLGLNFHWCPVPLRITLINVILKLNRNNIRRGLPIQVSYNILKPLIYKMGMLPVIRLYIFSRISRRGVVVPPNYWLQAARLRSESFSGGYSAEALWKKAVLDYKKAKTNRGRREHIYK